MYDTHDHLIPTEHDSCAIFAIIARDARPSHDNVEQAMDALVRMGHRSGEVEGEGDGCGVMLDLPRDLWSRRLEAHGWRPSLVEEPGFFVAHLFIDRDARGQRWHVQDAVRAHFATQGITILREMTDKVVADALGPRARADEPVFWQIAAICGDVQSANLLNILFDLAVWIEREQPIHVVSLSQHTAIYKVRGTAEVLRQYYPDLHDPLCRSAATIAHSRFSTNTATAFERVQPFTLLGHNGEINTISRLRREAEMLGFTLTQNGSDSQDLNRVVEHLIAHYGLTLAEAMEIIFPPIINEVKGFGNPALRDMYMYLRQAFGPFAQGPAGIVSRHGDELVFSVDALGLRPLWFVETSTTFVFTSERGFAPIALAVADPRPLAPGEKVGVLLHKPEVPALEANEMLAYASRGMRGVAATASQHELEEDLKGSTSCLTYDQLQEHVLSMIARRYPDMSGSGRFVTAGSQTLDVVSTTDPGRHHTRPGLAGEKRAVDNLQAATGWEEDDVKQALFMAETGKEPIGSLGYDGPLAALAGRRQNLADYFKESVAVVTNPAIDREREIEHFSTRAIFGRRPSLAPHSLSAGSPHHGAAVVETVSPLIVDGRPGSHLLPPWACRRVASSAGTYSLDDLLAELEAQATAAYGHALLPQTCLCLPATREPGETIPEALHRLAGRALAAVSMGTHLIVLDNSLAFTDGHLWIDAHLAVSAVDRALRAAGMDLRRRASLVVRARSLRNLHDIVLALGLGADGVVPYEIFEVAALGEKRPNAASRLETSGPRDDDMSDSGFDPAALTRVQNVLEALRHGLEKVISTLGIHELRGYDRLFSAIGLSPEVARLLGIPNFAGSPRGGLGLTRMADEDAERELIARGEMQTGRRVPNRIYPKVWKIAGQVAVGEKPYSDFADVLAAHEHESPVSLRHVLDLRFADGPVPSPEDVDLSAGDHALPLFIGSMSFGSQGEVAYRSYAEAAKRLNMIALTGEGGEIKDMMFRYSHNRGVQIASGRFGVNSVLLNSANLIEIKIGQGAKPGEGGHLPGKKVSAKVAAARNARPGVDLISPSNNHDIYSIEDLEQIIEELKTVNPRAKISVKVPIVPNIGTIAVGIAKARADIICLSGFDGGTGAARQHALRHVGLPAEIGTLLVHRALVDAGLRASVEVWCDGGMKSGLDVVKMIMMGANRVGFATMAMVALGCTACRGCQLDTCHVGIATQIETQEEATHKGMKRFVPREFEHAVQALCRVFDAIGYEVRVLTARLGHTRMQDLVGRSDLLYQARCLDSVDMGVLLDPMQSAVYQDSGCGTTCLPARPPRSLLSRQLATETVDRVIAGERHVEVYQERTMSSERVIGTYLSGLLVRERVLEAQGTLPMQFPEFQQASLVLNDGSVPGNGLASFHVSKMHIIVHGGAQDGLAKCAVGGRVAILKARGGDGQWRDGCVGKSFAYGAQRGLFIVQGDADSRAGIRLSGADLVLGGEITAPLDDSRGALATRANIKGFAFEYMTMGRALVLGDPGPWMCSGMTGGVVYLRLRPELGFDEAAIRRRIARGAKVAVSALDEGDWASVTELLDAYRDELATGGQAEAVAHISAVHAAGKTTFVKIVPENQQVDASISTE